MTAGDCNCEAKIPIALSVIKIGGSVITDEDCDGCFDSETTRRLAQELAPHAAGSIIVHGTGVVGKRPAVEENYVEDGVLPSSNPLLSIQVKSSLQDLNRRFIDAFLSAGVPVLPLDASSYFDWPSGKWRSNSLKRSLIAAVRGGVVPVFHGDILPQPDNSHSVISSDTIVLILTRVFRPKNVFFLTDVDGVFPRDESGEMGNAPIPVLRNEALAQIHRDSSDSRDVSGGMHEKVRVAFNVARYTGNCVIASGVRPGVAGKLLAGQEAPGTRVVASG